MLVEANISSVVVFDKAPRAGSFFATFPIHRKVRPGRYASHVRKAHLEPSFLEYYGNLRRGEQHLPGPASSSSPSTRSTSRGARWEGHVIGNKQSTDVQSPLLPLRVCIAFTLKVSHARIPVRVLVVIDPSTRWTHARSARSSSCGTTGTPSFTSTAAWPSSSVTSPVRPADGCWRLISTPLTR